MTDRSTPSLLLPFLLAALLCFTPPLSAAPNPGDDKPVELAELLVRGVPAERSVNPLARPVTGVFGTPRSLLETPRAVSAVTAALFRDRAIDGLKEIVVFAPGAATPSRFGKATVPNLRGDTGESYLNGQRRSYNLFGYFPGFQAAEAVELVRGPGSAVYGSGFFSGGYIDTVTKSPQFGPRQSELTVRLGSWLPGGGSHLQGSVQIDQTGEAVPGRLAWRAGYEGRGGDTFHRRSGVRDDRHDVFVALAGRPRPGTTWDVFAQVQWQSSPEILGVNRPTPALVERGLYTPGPSADAFPFPGPVAGGAPVPLDRAATLFSPGDFSRATVAVLQAIGRRETGPETAWTSRTLVEHVERRRYHAFEYAEWVWQTTVDQRVEWSAAFAGPGGEHAVVAGGAVRFEDRRSFTNYFNEYFYNFDLTRPGPYRQREEFPSSYFPGRPGPEGRLFFGAADGSPETTDSELWNPALFWQHEVRLDRRWTVLGGGRIEGQLAAARDPLPPLGTLAWRDRTALLTRSAHLSVVHHPGPRSALYATWQRARAVNGNVTGGGLMLFGPDGRLNRDDLRNLSELWELGGKWSLAGNSWFLGAALYEQRRARAERGGGRSDLLVRGLETELVWQPDLATAATLNLNWIDGRYVDSAPYQLGGRSIYDLYEVGTGPDGRGTGAGFSLGRQVPVGDYRIPGLSRVTLNGSLERRWAGGWITGISGSWQSRQPGNLDGEYWIPAQFTLNARWGWRAEPRRSGGPAWEWAIELLNLTDEDNWVHNGDTFMNNQLVFRELPRRLEGWARARW